MEGLTRFPKIFEPGIIGKLKLKNRIVMAPMGTRFTTGGTISRDHIAYFAEMAKGGVGLIGTECTTVNTRLCGRTGGFFMHSYEFINGHDELCQLVHVYGAKIAMQIYHPGRFSIPPLNAGQASVAPSPVAVTLSEIFPGRGLPLPPRELTKEEIYELIVRR